MSHLLEEIEGSVGRICGAIALDDGPDAAQDTLIQVFRDLGTLRDPSRLRAWVRRIATREAVRHARRASRERPTTATPVDARSVALDRVSDVRSVLEGLPPEQRAILVLRDLEGFSEEEAARQLDVALGTAKSRLHRARAAFRSRWSR
jgi:RNA polymerase sigma factor (sigma-70 family)